MEEKQPKPVPPILNQTNLKRTPMRPTGKPHGVGVGSKGSEKENQPWFLSAVIGVDGPNPAVGVRMDKIKCNKCPAKLIFHLCGGQDCKACFPIYPLQEPELQTQKPPMQTNRQGLPGAKPGTPKLPAKRNQAKGENVRGVAKKKRCAYH